MAYKKGNGGSMDSAKGLCSYRSNPMKQPSRTSSECGPALGVPANSDQVLANRLRKEAFRERDSLRGKNGM